MELLLDILLELLGEVFLRRNPKRKGDNVFSEDFSASGGVPSAVVCFVLAAALLGAGVYFCLEPVSELAILGAASLLWAAVLLATGLYGFRSYRVTLSGIRSSFLGIPRREIAFRDVSSYLVKCDDGEVKSITFRMKNGERPLVLRSPLTSLGKVILMAENRGLVRDYFPDDDPSTDHESEESA